MDIAYLTYISNTRDLGGTIWHGEYRHQGHDKLMEQRIADGTIITQGKYVIAHPDGTYLNINCYTVRRDAYGRLVHTIGWDDTGEAPVGNITTWPPKGT